MMIMKFLPSKALIIKINLVFLACFLVAYGALLLRPSTSVYHEYAASLVCSLRECHHKGEGGIKMKAVLEERLVVNEAKAEKKMVKREKPSFLNEMGRGMKIGMVNMEGEDISEWKVHGQIIKVKFEKVSKLLEWKELFPEWIDEEEEMDGTECPEIPMPDFNSYSYMDMIVVKLPCKYPEEGWGRDVYRLQVNLVAANLAVKRGKKGWNNGNRMKVVFLSKCRPMVEMFRCDELKQREGNWWYYEPDMDKLTQKVSLPIGSCKLALPLWGKEINEVYDISNIESSTKISRREAYATVLHSSETYVCGAITLAQSLLRTGTKRDLILLLDRSISKPKRAALIKAGWKLRFIKRIRNPKAEKNTYNEYNYSKFRLWQLTDYEKIIFIDADIIVQRNIDLLFHFPQMTATGNDASIFNSGIMVIEPSNCTFNMFMQRTKEIISYNGGDQGFLNEVYVWWHRLPRRVNFLKNFWSNNSNEVSVKNQLFGADPPKVYAIHYLGLKPWVCYRDYDCNWDIGDQRVYASDVAHKTWWKLHDSMDESLQKCCKLTKQRKIELEWDRNLAGKMGFKDEHWRINVTDPRKFT
ncbi:UDP-glucuronate:xylan alpha-glucuronosyltransferase 2-like isoform X1 [Nicotiana tabacum]|uniref:UDP-glucuronate:xylan alpha-glucuronosyltransferase 2-like isoform X1 n=4 Tax=Nicotiana tabacum TaxID=4097 RepID=A0AC58SBF6_TOBAC|nr:UDP-glucuronate:xylan alpha-glucuronosyltransferase 2 isoform X1 [Nicotiana tomentosiformis]